MNYIKRLSENRIHHLLKTFPIVSILGARQVGKTMLAEHTFSNWKYFDLERSDHFDRISNDLEFFFKTESGNICFDEAQRLPVLFSHLRSVVDRFPKRRYLLLGSVSAGS